MPNLESIRVQAQFVLAAPHKLLHPGQLVIRRGRITELTSVCDARPDVNLGDTALAPGLVNAHTHLEFSDLSRPFPAGKHFPDWISQVVSHRRKVERELAPDEIALSRKTSIRSGLLEAYSTGTAAIADIVSMPWQISDLPTPDSFRSRLPASATGIHRQFNAPCGSQIAWSSHLASTSYPRVMAIPEMIGLTRDRLDASVTWANKLTASPTSESNLLLPFGISPHAPYSVLPEPIETALSQLKGSTIMAMHVAESMDELEWINEGRGAFQQSFERLGLPTPSVLPSTEWAIQLLQKQKRALLIHGNFLSASQVDQLADQRSVSIVYCPRTHSHFCHAAYPIALFQQKGIRVVFGTDSRASNPDLNLWSEVVEARRKHNTLSPHAAFAAVTSDSANAMGIDRDFGSLLEGKLAYAIATPSQTHWTKQNIWEEITSTNLKWYPLADLLG